MIRDIRMILTRLFTVALLMMVSMAAGAQVKVIYGKDGEAMKADEKGTIVIPQKEQKESLVGGTITITQEEPKDGKVRVNFTVAPASGYTYNDGNITLVAFIPLSSTRADNPADDITVHSSLTLTPKDKSQTDTSKPRYYYVDIDEGLGLWVKSATFEPNKREGAKAEGDTGPVEVTTQADITAHTEKLYMLRSDQFQSFYMIKKADGKNGINTSNLPNNDMLWYFLAAGTDPDDGLQYYYVVNKSSSNSSDKYICVTNYGNDNNTDDARALSLSDFDDSNAVKFKFSIEETTLTGYYRLNIKPYKSGARWICVNKGSGNVNFDKPVRLTNSTYVNSNGSRWAFVPYNGTFTWPTPPFTPSTDEERHYYKIKNAAKSYGSYYMSTGSQMVTFASTPSDNMVWIFKEAPVDNSTPWFKYYYIVNPESDDQYMYYEGNTDNGDKTDAVSIKAKSSENEDRYQFIIVQAARTVQDVPQECYTIIPKLLRDKAWSSNSLGPKTKSDGSNMDIIPGRSASNDDNVAHWVIEDADGYTNYCAKPVITFSNTTGKVTITTETGGASIHYTTDGTTVPSSSVGESYGEPFTITGTTTVKAIATKTGMGRSEVASTTITQVATPSVINNGTQIVISCETEGATKYYSIDGGAYTEYNDNAPLAASSYLGKTITAKATKTGWIDSGTYSLHIDATCNMPTFTLDYTTGIVTISSTTEGAQIYYTINGIDPGETPGDGEGATLGTSLTLTSAKTVKARAYKGGFNPSVVASVSYSQVATPTIQNNGSNAISITATEGAEIHYLVGGENPDYSSTLYDGTPLKNNVSNKVIKAKAFRTGMVPSSIGENTVTLQCNKPIITKGADKITISCDFPASDDIIIYYSVNGSDPTDVYPEGGISYTDYGFTVKAIATATDYSNSDEASRLIMPKPSGDGTAGDPYIIQADEFDKFVSQADEEPGAYFKLVGNLEATSNQISTPFTGTFEVSSDNNGDYYKITGLRHPLFSTVSTGAVIKNVMLKDVQIDQDGPVGAIAAVAEGYSRIYNCGILPSSNLYDAATETSHLSSSGGTNRYCGGIVGWLKGDSRVINCFSYAKIEGGTDVAGIVGHNEAVYSDENGSYGSTTEVNDGKYYRLKTAVVNCMFYGNITSGSNRWPVYGGAKMVNNTATGINNYDFYRAEASLGLVDNNHYNCSFPAKEEYLTQYEYYRYLLNSNRELCGWWVGADNAPSGMTTAQVQAVAKDASLIAKWVLDPSIAPYPILKSPGKYPSVINQSPEPATSATSAASGKRIDKSTKNWVDRASSSNTKMVNPKAAPETDGRILGTIKVNISNGSNSTVRYCAITAMDIDNNDFCYGKIQLPYYNSIFGDPDGTTWAAKYGGNYTANVVVGWTISSPTGTIPSESDNSGTDDNGIAYDHIYSTNSQSGFNFADRYCTTKDENRVFAQGGYYYVPYGVSEITITAKWAAAIYLDNGADHSYDRVYMSNSNAGTDFAPAGHRPAILGNGKTVQTASVSSKIPSGGKVYDNAIVLVGNHQYRLGNNNINTLNGCTIISADFDLDDEPDNCLIWQLGQGTSRYNICPIRFDFLPIVEMGLAMKEDGSTQYYSLGCYRPRGHFEVTETSLIHFGQFEFGNKDRTIVDPLILNGGIFDQYCKGTMSAAPDDTNGDYINYIILGGNVRMPSFTPGAHVREASNWATFHCPVSVMGGNIDYLYLTGNFNDKVTPKPDNPHCYIDGGNYKQVAAAAKEGIDGNVTFKVNHSIIKEFYGGSTLADKLITGNIDVTIDNSKVTKYCGGPKFGNMNLDEANPANNKTIRTNATGTTFDVFYGGGNGGTSYMQYASTDKTFDDATVAYSWESSSWGNLQSYSPGVYYKVENTDPKGIGYKANYEMEIVNSSAGTDEKKAIFRTYFYAAQFSATNTGPVGNYLTDCKVLTNFYGGGNLGGVKGDVSSILTNTEVQGSAFGAGYSASVPEVTIYNKNKTAPTINVYTGIITPTPDPDPSSTSSTYTWTNDPSLSTSSPKSSDGQYYYTEEPLGSLGTITGNIYLTIKGNTTINGKVFKKDGTQDATKTGGVYGGGDESAVNGSTFVTLKGSATVNGNVFGGGNNGDVSGSATVNIVEQ